LKEGTQDNIEKAENWIIYWDIYRRINNLLSHMGWFKNNTTCTLWSSLFGLLRLTVRDPKIFLFFLEAFVDARAQKKYHEEPCIPI